MNFSPDILLQQLSAVTHANVLLIGGIAMLTIGLWRPALSLRTEQSLFGSLTLFVLAATAVGTYLAADHPATAGGLFVADIVTRNGAWLAILVGVVLTLLNWERTLSGRTADQYGCFLLMLSGLVYASAANDLTSLFLGLELVSIPTTVLLGMTRSDVAGREATLKYFTLAAFASAIFLLGCSYLFGIAGSTYLPAINTAIANSPTSLAVIAIGLAVCGLCFRVTAVPFHFYAPDVFSGASLPMAATLSVVPKIAGFVAIIRLLGGDPLNSGLAHHIIPMLLVISALTMTLGNFFAIIQTRLRRLLAYSSVAHSGYMLLAVAALMVGDISTAVVFNYLFVYVAMTIGLFSIVAAVEGDAHEELDEHADDLSRLNGLFYRRPALVIGGVICLLSLTGLPLTAGFWAKLQVFLVSLVPGRFDMKLTAILMAFNAAIAAVYYLGIINRFFQPATGANTHLRVSPSSGIACAICSILTIVWFFAP